jgi:hypothetical protein
VRLVGKTVAGAEGSSDRFRGERDCAKVVVNVSPTGTPDQPGLRVRLRLTKNVGIVIPDLLNPPGRKPDGGWDWNAARKTYSDRARGPKGSRLIPSLQKLITLDGGVGWTVERTLAELSRTSRVPLLGEYDPCFVNPYERSENPQIILEPDDVKQLPVWKALDAVARRFDLEWDYQKGWIWIRSPRTLLAWSGELDLSPPQREKAPGTANVQGR